MLHKCCLNLLLTDELYYYFHFTSEEQKAEKDVVKQRVITGALIKGWRNLEELMFELHSGE